jgi:hypothetical protein
MCCSLCAIVQEHRHVRTCEGLGGNNFGHRVRPAGPPRL